MAKIKNMGTATMRFGEGIIVTGSADANPAGANSLVVSGNVKIVEGGLTAASFISSEDIAIFGGNVYVDQKIMHTGDVDTLINFDDNKIVLQAGGRTMIKISEGSIDQVLIMSGGAGTSPEPDSFTDTNFFVSGSVGSRGSSTAGTSAFGGDVVISGSLYAKQRHVQSIKYNSTDSSQQYVRFDAAGSNSTPGVNNKFLAPAGGRLLLLVIRCTSAANGTNIAFHKASDGSANVNTTATETIGVDINAAHSAFQVQFTETSSFNAGDILGLSVNPSSTPNDVNITCIWEFDFTD